MTTLAADAPRSHLHAPLTLSYPVIAADIIYEGAAVGENGSGYSRPLQAGDVFQGFALAQVDNSGGAAGDLTVRVSPRGLAYLTISGVLITANDRPFVYASDDDTFTLTATSNSPIGCVASWVASNTALVEYDAALARVIAAATA